MQQLEPCPWSRSMGEAGGCPTSELGSPATERTGALSVCSTFWLQPLLTVLTHLFCAFGTGVILLYFYPPESWFWKSATPLKLMLIKEDALFIHCCAAQMCIYFCRKRQGPCCQSRNVWRALRTKQKMDVLLCETHPYWGHFHLESHQPSLSDEFCNCSCALQQQRMLYTATAL